MPALADTIHAGRRMMAVTVKLLIDDLFQLRTVAVDVPLVYRVGPSWPRVTHILKGDAVVVSLRPYNALLGQWMQGEEVLWVRSAGAMADIERYVNRLPEEEDDAVHAAGPGDPAASEPDGAAPEPEGWVEGRDW